MNIEIRIKGIPASVEVRSAKFTKPDSRADSDWDYYGGWELDYTICDSKGRPADWLQRKLSEEDLMNIEQQIIQEIDYQHAYA